MKDTLKLTEDEKVRYEKQFIFLEELRSSGIVNMYGATPYLQEQFKMEYQEAVRVLSLWIKNYEELFPRRSDNDVL